MAPSAAQISSPFRVAVPDESNFVRIQSRGKAKMTREGDIVRGERSAGAKSRQQHLFFGRGWARFLQRGLKIVLSRSWQATVKRNDGIMLTLTTRIPTRLQSVQGQTNLQRTLGTNVLLARYLYGVHFEFCIMPVALSSTRLDTVKSVTTPSPDEPSETLLRNTKNKTTVLFICTCSRYCKIWKAHKFNYPTKLISQSTYMHLWHRLRCSTCQNRLFKSSVTIGE